MIQIGDTIVSEDIRIKHFVCDLEACKGACCVLGDAGAPLEPEEAEILDQIYPEVLPYLPEHSQRQLLRDGRWLREDGDYETPLVEGKECVYVVFDDGVAKCGIEKAWADGKVAFRKPISCHLYPIRIKRLRSLEVDALNYDQWSVCNPACTLGVKLKVPIFRFLREPLTRKYGEAWYNELCEVFEAIDKEESRHL